ncbi:hypothetical protein CC86DRAFT_377708 [Ophiobolus disseminans]|uniref:Uncharacterized protein n=1 Tax=Ophiobolus disseminans TaxID=1469910 RepID=A0A6A7AIM6_9PLEO|nr:hypothetical protein CC86DRAFT_377708 [Ophiobolus disseminans]
MSTPPSPSPTPPSRPRLKPLNVPPPWRAPRLPTPRRATFPPAGPPPGVSAPPVPPLSFWTPDTPFSPINPFLIPPQTPATRAHALFPPAAPLLPASPLSMFDRAVSPMSGLFVVSPMSPTLHSWIPAPVFGEQMVRFPVSPLTPHWLDPRTPPCVPGMTVPMETGGGDGEGGKKGGGVVAVRRDGVGVRGGFLRWMVGGKEDKRESKKKRWMNRGWKGLMFAVPQYQYLAVRVSQHSDEGVMQP